MKSAESSRGSVSDSRRPPVKVGGPRSYGFRDMPNKILIPLQSLISCFLESPTNRQQWAQLRDSEEATLWYLPKALTRPRKSALAAMDCAKAWLRGATPCPRSGATTESARLRRHRSGREELSHVRGQGGGREELPHARGQGSCVEELPHA